MRVIIEIDEPSRNLHVNKVFNTKPRRMRKKAAAKHSESWVDKHKGAGAKVLGDAVSVFKS
jgi:hypothetical protein